MTQFERINWTNKFSIGNTEIDGAHKKLIDIYNEMEEFVRSKQTSREFARILSEMTDYSLTHFKREEEYMHKMAYPKLPEHEKYHRDYIFKVATYNNDLASNNSLCLSEIMKFLEVWWVHHILEIDIQYENYKAEIHSEVKY